MAVFLCFASRPWTMIGLFCCCRLYILTLFVHGATPVLCIMVWVSVDKRIYTHYMCHLVRYCHAERESGLFTDIPRPLYICPHWNHPSHLKLAGLILVFGQRTEDKITGSEQLGFECGFWCKWCRFWCKFYRLILFGKYFSNFRFFVPFVLQLDCTVDLNEWMTDWLNFWRWKQNLFCFHLPTCLFFFLSSLFPYFVFYSLLTNSLWYPHCNV